jgi:hypothetical protein
MKVTAFVAADGLGTRAGSTRLAAQRLANGCVMSRQPSDCATANRKPLE